MYACCLQNLSMSAATAHIMDRPCTRLMWRREARMDPSTLQIFAGRIAEVLKPTHINASSVSSKIHTGLIGNSMNDPLRLQPSSIPQMSWRYFITGHEVEQWGWRGGDGRGGGGRGRQ